MVTIKFHGQTAHANEGLFELTRGVVALWATKVWISGIFPLFPHFFQEFSGILESYCVHVNQLAKSFHLMCPMQISGISGNFHSHHSV